MPLKNSVPKCKGCSQYDMEEERDETSGLVVLNWGVNTRNITGDRSSGIS